MNMLSGREAEVATQVILGRTNKAAADKLFVTEKTIKFHLTNIYKKLGVKTRAELIHGWFTHTLDKETSAQIQMFMPSFEKPPAEEKSAVNDPVTVSKRSTGVELIPGCAA